MAKACCLAHHNLRSFRKPFFFKFLPWKKCRNLKSLMVIVKKVLAIEVKNVYEKVDKWGIIRLPLQNFRIYFERMWCRNLYQWFWIFQICILVLWMICLLCGLLPSLFIFGSSGTPNRSTSNQNARWPDCTILQEM